MTEGTFITPRAPLERWEDLTANEQQWIEFIRVISVGRDPEITLKRVRAMRELPDAGKPTIEERSAVPPLCGSGNGSAEGAIVDWLH